MCNDIRGKLLWCMNEISSRMQDTIFLGYFNKYENDKKYLYGVFLDAYKTVEILCYSMQKIGVSQSAMLVRQLLTQTSIAVILVNHPELLKKHVEHYKFRMKIVNLSLTDQKKEISKKFGVLEKNAFPYLEYGWIPFDKKNENGMIEYADLKDIIPWKTTYFNKMTHAGFNSLSFTGENHDFPILNTILHISAKLFDHICVSFHKLTNFDFKFDNRDMFMDEFRNVYSSFINKPSFETNSN